MRTYITKTFESFKIDEPSTMDELLEKLSVVEESLLDSVGAEKVDISMFIDSDSNINDLDDLVLNASFNKVLNMKGLKRANVEHTDDYETFLLSPFKFCLIYEKDKNSLHNPDYLLLQTFNSTQQTWNIIRLFKINGDFSNFYKKLTNRTIELSDNGETFIYQTSNKNQWDLINRESNKSFPKKLRKEELLKIITELK